MLESDHNPDTVARVAQHAIEVGLGYEAVVLADRTAMPAWHLEFQRPLDPDDQDRQLGLDTYCVVLPTGATGYGCLASASVSEQRLRLTFHADQLTELGLTDPTLEIKLALEAASLEEFVNGLRQVLGQPRGPALGGLLT
ncbi:Imm10 family immunity protein [Sinomonas mesophila]|uniref:Imm10 family immunity protein n=1 Tax=Sinomonas mesophila TaxID=1531955 RepID=UPI0009876E4B|nr:Imm10 family immunity protein [Sinomonas mesophila]